jgi:large subunit ribosomal protein L27e
MGSQHCEETKSADNTSSLEQVVIIQPIDTGNKSHPYGHALVAGIERYPSKITRRMSKSKQEKRSKVKPFIKVVNYNHLMPTRFTLELEGLKGAVSSDTFKEVSQREEAKKTVKKTLEERYVSGKNRWFFTPLSTSPVLCIHQTSPLTLSRISSFRESLGLLTFPDRILIVSSFIFGLGGANGLGCIQHQMA